MIELLIQAAILASSLTILAVASFFAIKYVEDLMELTRLSEIAAGFAILSVMTTLPELMVASFAVLQGRAGISIGDILGSHVFNIGVVVGLLAAFGSLKTCGTTSLVELVDLLFLASLIPLLLVIFKINSPLVGIVLIAIFIFSLYRISKRRAPASADVERVFLKKIEPKRTVPSTIAITIVAAVVVVITARFVILSASEIINLLNVSTVVMGAKIVAIGTSLPELAFGFAAMKRGRVHLALGDAVGANLTTITLVLGLVLVFSPFIIDLASFVEILAFVLVMNLVLWRFLTKGGVSQMGGIVLIMMYILFQAILQ